MARATLQLSLKANDVVGKRYVVLKKLGAGGGGSVYRARLAKEPDRTVAIKVLENAADEARFRREAQVMQSATRSPYVLKLIDLGTHDRHPYLVLEYMEGGSVRDLLNKRGRLSSEEAAWVLVMAVRGLRDSKTVHRDLKPENLLVGRGDLIVGDARKGCVVKLADFGLAKSFDPARTRLTNTGQVMGTPYYMSPEQCRNMRSVTVQADIYSLGVILYELVTGRPPFEADNQHDIMAAHCTQEPRFPRGMDSQVRMVCERCLRKNPTERYRSLYALERDLRTIARLDEPEPDELPWTWIVSGVGLVIFSLLLWLMHDQLADGLRLWWNG